MLTSQEFSRDNYSCLSPKSQSHGGVARLLVCVASLSNVNVGTDMSSPPSPHIPQQPFYTLPVSIEFLSLFFKSMNSRVPTVLQCYLNQKENPCKQYWQ